jgi:hypothetical protein
MPLYSYVEGVEGGRQPGDFLYVLVR